MSTTKGKYEKSTPNSGSSAVVVDVRYSDAQKKNTEPFIIYARQVIPRGEVPNEYIQGVEIVMKEINSNYQDNADGETVEQTRKGPRYKSVFEFPCLAPGEIVEVQAYITFDKHIVTKDWIRSLFGFTPIMLRMEFRFQQGPKAIMAKARIPVRPSEDHDKPIPIFTFGRNHQGVYLIEKTWADDVL